jgi:GAF domain-containing protein
MARATGSGLSVNGDGKRAMDHEVTEFDQQMLEIYSELDIDRLMHLVVQYASRRLEAGGSSIFLRDDITGHYVLRGTTGITNGARMPPTRIEYALGEGLTGWIAKHGRPLRITNPADEAELRCIADDLSWSQKYSELSAQSGLAYLGVPILSRDRHTVLGVLRVSRKPEGQAFNERDERLLSHVAAMIGVAIENSQRYERERRRARYLRLLLESTGELNLRRPTHDMLSALAERIRRGFRTEACLIFLQAEEDTQQLALEAASGLPESLKGLRCSSREGISGQIFRTGRPVQIRIQSAFKRWNDPYMRQIAAHLPSREYRSFVGVPLRVGDETLGTLELINKIPSAPGHRDWFTDDDEEYLLLLSAAVGGVLEGSRYLKALGDVGVTAMRLQRVAAFGTLAQRIRHEAANPLTVARLAAANLRREVEEILQPGGTETSMAQRAEFCAPERRESILRRLDIIEASLDEVSDKLLEMLRFSQQIGFVRTNVPWNDLVRGVLIWLSAERQRRNLDVRAVFSDLPAVYVEANEVFGVLATALRVVMEVLADERSTLEVSTAADEAGHSVRTEIRIPEVSRDGQFAVRERLMRFLHPPKGSPEDLSPLRLEWALAKETIERDYAGSLDWHTDEGAVCCVLALPVRQG